MTETVADLLPTVERVAKRVHFLYGLEEEEAYGILSLEVVEGQKDYLVLFRARNTGIIERRLKQVAGRHARADRIRRMAERCQVVYDPEYVRLFLPFYFDRADWSDGPADETADKFTTGDAIDTALDIAAAWPRLKPWQHSVIVARYLTAPDANGETDWHTIAQETGRVNGEAAERAYRQATADLAVEMNGAKVRRKTDHDGPGSRRPITNANATAVISNQG
ncbi:hypothetical protein AB0M54_45840 [Actinoplanes sp. NPDC051470]|uniref:hypothetical protein n=1 Tax=Actinoplanes sp. NPDC051470 TaxID=3157224 RepID=UPI003429862C